MPHKYFPRVVLFVTVVAIVCTACGSDTANTGQTKRIRRADLEDTSTTKEPVKLPSLSTTSVPVVQDTLPVVELAFFSAAQIAEIWSEKNLCGLIAGTQAQKILSMNTIPTPHYSYSAASGARCSFASSSGDEMYIEYSTSSYANARSVDVALQAEGNPVVIEGVGGVSKTNKATGTMFELNFSGAASNEWIVLAPKTSQSKELAKVLITSLR